jgi:hypothetical protein
MKEEFYLGYLPYPPKLKKKIIGIAWLVVLAGALICYLTVRNQSGFNNGTFEFGKHTVLHGTLIKNPVTMLLLSEGKENMNPDAFRSVLLVGYGKHGSGSIISAEEERRGIDLDGQKIQLEGTLIYHDGKTLMEITDKTISGMKLIDPGHSAIFPLQPVASGVTLKGEIIDPKCYFGVMKPGYSKPHRDCAIRCISGGIPPVLCVRNDKNEATYFLLQSRDGSSITEKVLPYVAEQVHVEGNVQKMNDWLVLQVNSIYR